MTEEILQEDPTQIVVDAENPTVYSKVSGATVKRTNAEVLNYKEKKDLLAVLKGEKTAEVAARAAEHVALDKSWDERIAKRNATIAALSAELQDAASKGAVEHVVTPSEPVEAAAAEDAVVAG